MRRLALLIFLAAAGPGCAAKVQALNTCTASVKPAADALRAYRAAAKAHDEAIVARGGGDELVDDRLTVAKERGDLAKPLIQALTDLPEGCRGR